MCNRVRREGGGAAGFNLPLLSLLKRLYHLLEKGGRNAAQALEFTVI